MWCTRTGSNYGAFDIVLFVKDTIHFLCIVGNEALISIFTGIRATFLYSRSLIVIQQNVWFKSKKSSNRTECKEPINTNTRTTERKQNTLN